MNNIHRRTRRTLVAIALALTLGQATQAAAQQYSFETIAGDYDGDGGPALQAHLGAPTGVVFDRNGNMFVADAFRHRIRKIGADGTIQTVAGTGVPGYSEQAAHAPGDTSALGRINRPQNLLADRFGNVYFSDGNNHRVRKLWTDGRITVVAGNGTPLSSGDGGPAVNAGVRQPYGLAMDAFGNLYVAEYFGYRVRKVTPQGTISTVAGNGVPGFSGDGGAAAQASLNEPMGIALDSQGNLFIADSRNERVRKVTPSGTITTFASGIVNTPMDVSFDNAGNLYVSSVCGILKYASGGQALPPLFEDPSCASVSNPERVVFSSTGAAYYADSHLARVYRKGAQEAVPVAVVGRGGFFGDGGPAVDASLSRPTGLGVDAQGAVYVADWYPNNRFRKIGTDGTISTAAGSGEFGTEDPEGVPALQATFASIHDAEVDASGNVYYVDRGAPRIRRMGADGKLHTFAGTGAFGFSGDGGPAKDAMLSQPRRVAIDAAGNVFIADRSNHRVRKVNTAGIITTVAGNGVAGFGGDGGPALAASLNAPSAVAVDSAGNLYIADELNRRIRKVAASGIITTVAGNGSNGNTGDGGPAVNASLGSPSGVAVAANGEIFVAAGALRKISATGRISTVSRLEHSAFDVAVGADGAIYVANQGGRVLKGVPVAGAAKRGARR